MHLSLENHVEHLCLELYKARCLVYILTTKDPQKGIYQQPCAEADYFLLWKKGMPSTGRVQILQNRDALDTHVTFLYYSGT